MSVNDYYSQYIERSAVVIVSSSLGLFWFSFCERSTLTLPMINMVAMATFTCTCKFKEKSVPLISTHMYMLQLSEHFK